MPQNSLDAFEALDLRRLLLVYIFQDLNKWSPARRGKREKVGYLEGICFSDNFIGWGIAHSSALRKEAIFLSYRESHAVKQ